MIRSCPHCGRKNRIPGKHLAQRGKCGGCKGALDPRDTPLEVGPADFDDIVAHAPVPVLVDFWAEWCGPCRMAAPEVAKVARATAGKALVLKVNTERHPQLAARYGVRGIPNFIVFRHGDVAMQQAGLVPAATMQTWLQ